MSARSTFAVVIIGLFLSTTACSEPLQRAAAIGELQTSMAADDTPPTEADVVYLDEGTSRLLAEVDGLLFFTGVGTTDFGSAACLAIVAPGPGQTVGGCDLTDGEVISAPYVAFGVEARLTVDGADVGAFVDEGWRQPHPNLILRKE